MFSSSMNSSSIPPLIPDMTVLNTILPDYSSFLPPFSSYFHSDILSYLLLTVVLARIISLLQYVGTYFFPSVEIRFGDKLYRALDFWISQQGFAKNALHTVAATEARDDWFNNGNGNEIGNQREPFYTPVGTTTFFYKWSVLQLKRVPYATNTSTPMLLDAEYIVITAFWSSKVLKRLLENARQFYIEYERRHTIVYRAMKRYGFFQWIQYTSTPHRDLSSVILGVEEKRNLMADIEQYLDPATRSWYHDRGIPYRRGYLLYGPPGTGKTSLVLAIAGKLRLGIYLLNLDTNSLTEEGLADLFRTLPDRCILLLEDIDCVGISQKRSGSSAPEAKDQSGKSENHLGQLSLSTLLNAIDGAGAPEGHLLFMTTNRRQKLDPALIRPGRVDMQIPFEKADKAAAKKLFHKIYTTPSDNSSPDDSSPPMTKISEQVSTNCVKKDIATLATEFADLIPEGKFTVAELQGYLLSQKNASASIEGIQEWVGKTCEK
ncbi:hypothetical protein AJ79_09314 [Helicocarpus griseus UAMH5409]|uniref:AAA+ ATPase domain-containing protein n=1 Tax=Helicocarpus griseus UAMH5409 TaxID=1447875 RepID=A0A2B7WKZ2_9EURO|nr:hypothetical protein AJ79_09314 [Helicocarpus griseus UAMH5409]